MISIDNAVELMVKTYLGLPRRITGLAIPRREYEVFSQSFPRLLDALETHGADKLDGIDLGEIEWYHRLRNELYHQGNGLTVERDKVEVYAELANLLFDNLFGVPLIKPDTDGSNMLGGFMAAWIAFERMLALFDVGTGTSHMPLDALRRLAEDNVISTTEFDEINGIRSVRSSVVHGMADPKTAITPELIRRLTEITSDIKGRLTDATE